MHNDKPAKERKTPEQSEANTEHDKPDARESAYPEDDYWRTVGEKSRTEPDDSVDPENGLRWEQSQE